MSRELSAYLRHLQRADALSDLGRGEQALAEAQQAIAAAPERSEGYVQAARAQLLLGRNADAWASCEAALGFAPDSLDALTLGSFALSGSGEHERALELADDALRRSPEEVVLMVRRACVLRDQGGLPMR